jgi:hypothetical protein
LLERLLYRLALHELVLASGSTRWLAKAGDDLRGALEMVRANEIDRSAGSDELARRRARAATRTRAGGPCGMWADILAEHQSALRTVIGDVRRLADDNEALLQLRLAELAATPIGSAPTERLAYQSALDTLAELRGLLRADPSP